MGALKRVQKPLAVFRSNKKYGGLNEGLNAGEASDNGNARC